MSRETRQVIALRDDVLDEINQLYFERQRVLLKLDVLSLNLDPGHREPGREGLAGERALLLTRAAELAAGLDAWTGGWFSAQLRAAAAHRPAAFPTASPRL